MPATSPKYLSSLSIRHFPFALIGILLFVSCSGLIAPNLRASNNPVPYIDLVSPVSVNPGTTGVTLTILGTGYVSTSIVQWNSIALTTTFVSSKKLTASVPDSFVAAIGLGAITVVSPGAGDGTSNVFYFPVAASEASTQFPSSPSSSVSVGNTPQGITTADLNGDGKLDLAVANSGDDTVTILLGNGNGAFTTKSTPSAGTSANWIAVGDFNGDGKLDLAVANSGSPGPAGVTILIGNGDGTYTRGDSLTTGDDPFAITTADFNGDGHLDLAVSNANDNTITVFLGNGNGTFGTGATYAVGASPEVIVPGDFNEDGILDLAVSNLTDGTVSVLLGVGDGTFHAQHAFSSGGSGQPIGLIAADFNKDNHLDLAAVNASDVAILLGNGAGSFTLHANPTTGSGDLIAGVTGDYNGDGNLDIVLSDRTAGEAFLFLGMGNGNFGTATTFTTASGAFGVATADFNGDGALDLAVANGNANNVSIFLQTLPVSLAPSSLAFGNQAVGVPSSPAKTITFTNNSGSTVAIVRIAFAGTDSGDFSTGGTCSTASPVVSGGTCTITVTFTPGVAGARSATLMVTDTAANSPQTLAVSGTGVILAPTISKVFGAASIALNGTTTLSFTITNPSGNTISLTGIAFTDSLPAGLLVASPNGLTGSCGGGTITATAGAGSVSLSDATLAAGGTCAFGVSVGGISAGAQANTTGAISSNESGAGATSNTATITVVSPPSISKVFGAATIPLQGSTTLSFTLTNPNTATALTAVGFGDTFPAGLKVSSPSVITGSCPGGSIFASAGSGSVIMSGANLAASGSCTFSVNVTGTAAGVQNNVAGGAGSTEGGVGTGASASIAVVGPPSIAKAFGAATIGLNASTSLTITITNPSANTVGLAGVTFTDSLPVGIVVSTPNGLANTCGGSVTAVAGSGNVSLAAGSVAINGNCTVTVNVTGTASGSYTNVTGSVSSANGGTGNTAAANLTVASPPVISKMFGAATVALNGSTSLNFTVNNPNSSSALAGVAFTDSLPAGLVIATPNGLAGTCGTGTITATAGLGSVSLAGATLAASGSCAFSVNVTGTAGGVKNNSVSVTSTTAGVGNTSNASVTVIGPPTIAKSFGAATVALNGSTALTFTLNNPNASSALTGAGFTDSLPSGLVVTTPNGVNNTCGGTATAVAGSESVSLSGATLAGSASCSLAVNVTGTTAGTQNNTTGAVTSTQGGAGGTASASVAVLGPPSIAKAFGAASIGLNVSTSLTFTITNPPANTVGLTGVAFVDSLPSGIVVATPNGVANTCGGTVIAAAGSGSVSLAGATVAANVACVISVNVTATALGAVANTTGTISSTNGGTGNTASASLTVGSPAIITSGNSDTFTVGVANSLTITTTGVPTPSITETGALPSGLMFVDNGNGTATLSGTPLASGTPGIYIITLTAHNGAGPDSVQTFTITIGKGTPTVTWAAPTAISYGTALSGTQLDATASVAGTFVYAPVAGTVLGVGSQTLSVTFTPTDTIDFTTASGSVTLVVNKGTPSIVWAMPPAITYGTALGAMQLDASTAVAGTFAYNPAAGVILNAGTQNLSVTFTPTDTADDSTATGQVSLIVNPAGTTIGLVSSGSTANFGANVTFTATVSSTAGTATGSVTFLDGGTTFGIVPLAAGTAAFSTSTLTVGPHSIGATYSGSANFAASNAANILETVQAAQFTLGVTAPTYVVQAGQTSNIPLTVTPVGGFTGPVQFSLTGLPPKTTFAFSPPVLTLGANAGVDMLTITTQLPSNNVTGQVNSPARTIFAGGILFPLVGLVLGGVGFARRGKGKGTAWVVLLVLFAGAGIFAGCAGEPGYKYPGTPEGRYALTVTATAVNSPGTAAQSTTVTLIVK